MVRIRFFFVAFAAVTVFGASLPVRAQTNDNGKLQKNDLVGEYRGGYTSVNQRSNWKHEETAELLIVEGADGKLSATFRLHQAGANWTVPAEIEGNCLNIKDRTGKHCFAVKKDTGKLFLTATYESEWRGQPTDVSYNFFRNIGKN